MKFRITQYRYRINGNVLSKFLLGKLVYTGPNGVEETKVRFKTFNVDKVNKSSRTLDKELLNNIISETESRRRNLSYNFSGEIDRPQFANRTIPVNHTPVRGCIYKLDESSDKNIDKDYDHKLARSLLFNSYDYISGNLRNNRKNIDMSSEDINNNPSESPNT